jgi:hypothetical protein
MRDTLEQNKEFVGASMAAFFSGVAVFALPNPQEIVGGIIDSVGQSLDYVWQGIANQLQKIVDVIGNQAVKVIESIGNLVVVPFKVLSNIFQSLSEGASNVVEAIFGAGVVGPLTFAAEGPLGIPSIGFGILGMLIAGLGIGLMVGTDLPWYFDDLGTGAGSVGVIVGAMIGVWGFFPNWSKWILGLTFTAMFMIVAFTYLQIVRNSTKRTTV